MFSQITPESFGLSSKSVYEYVNGLKIHNLTMHGIIMMKGDDIFYESYNAPFNVDSVHRMYSQTKSLVSLAIGILVNEGKIKLSDKIASYFPEYINESTDPILLNQTIEHNLTMTTCIRCEKWFKAEEDDRVKLYFNQKAVKPLGESFEYDSAGSQVLSTIVEKVSGQSLFDFLNDKIFKKIGTFKTSYMLKVPGGHCWGDSGLMCTLRDMASIGRLVLNNGNYDGQQIIDSSYIKEATSCKVSTKNQDMPYKRNGYGYQIWMLKNGYAFYGMGNQLTLIFPEYDIVVCTIASDEGLLETRELIIDGLYDMLKKIGIKTKEDRHDYEKLLEFSDEQVLRYLKPNSIEPVDYIFNEQYLIKDASSVTRFILQKYKDLYILTLEVNGKDVPIMFKIGENYFGKLLFEGYSDLVGKETTKGHYYNIASSGVFVTSTHLRVDVQVIDKYFGNMFIDIIFKKNDASVMITKHAENFLDEFVVTK